MLSRPRIKTDLGSAICGDSREKILEIPSRSIDLIFTSPPFCLTSKKEYGNETGRKYLDWFADFATDWKRVLKRRGSLVIDIGGAWKAGKPVRSLNHFKLLIMLCERFGFHLAQEFYWYNPSKLPAPAQWVTIDRVRVKDSVNCLWWLSASENPKASNEHVLVPYSSSMEERLRKPQKRQERPSGHVLSEWLNNDLGAAIPPNLLAIANTASNTKYHQLCKKHNVAPHPARFPEELPEFFIRMLTDEGDTVLDPFAGSCTTGAVAERLRRKWICIEKEDDYLEGATFRFQDIPQKRRKPDSNFYTLPRVGYHWQNSGQES